MGVSLLIGCRAKSAINTWSGGIFLQGQEFRLQFDNLFDVLKYEKGYVKNY